MSLQMQGMRQERLRTHTRKNSPLAFTTLSSQVISVDGDGQKSVQDCEEFEKEEIIGLTDL